MRRRRKTDTKFFDASLHLFARCAGLCHAGEVAFEVREKDRHAGVRQHPRHQLQGFGFAGAGRPRNEPMPVHHAQGKSDR